MIVEVVNFVNSIFTAWSTSVGLGKQIYKNALQFCQNVSEQGLWYHFITFIIDVMFKKRAGVFYRV